MDRRCAGASGPRTRLNSARGPIHGGANRCGRCARNQHLFFGYSRRSWRGATIFGSLSNFSLRIWDYTTRQIAAVGGFRNNARRHYNERRGRTAPLPVPSLPFPSLPVPSLPAYPAHAATAPAAATTTATTTTTTTTTTTNTTATNTNTNVPLFFAAIEFSTCAKNGSIAVGRSGGGATRVLKPINRRNRRACNGAVR
jgi:hypothetical protein